MKEWLEHNTALVIGIVICIGIAIFAYGCQSTGQSILQPDKKVTAEELQLEVNQVLQNYENSIKLAELSLAEIQRQDELKQKLFEFGVVVAETGTINPLGVIGLAGYVLGIGAYLNGRKKDVVIARDKTLLTSTVATDSTG